MTWLLLGLLGVFYHNGPGKNSLQLDDASQHIAHAEEAAQAGDWAQVDLEYSAALQSLPSDRVAEQQRIGIERANAQMQINQLPEAWTAMQALVGELGEQPEAERDPELYADAKQALATSQFYLTWLMRLEGRPRDDWEPEVESARQIYKQLAEDATDQGNGEEAQKYAENLEASIRLARMDLGELQGRSLPKQCSGCCSGDCKKPGKKSGKKPSEKPKDARGATSGPPVDGGGS